MTQTTLLIILDGWGISPKTQGNAIKLANTPNFDYLISNQPNAVLHASGTHVGLPKYQAGNSEVGHLHIGSGKILEQDLVKINNTIANNNFHTTKIKKIIEQTKQNKAKLHITGLLSDGGVHSHQNHLYAIIKIAEQQNCPTLLHLILDGRDTAPKSAMQYLEKIEKLIANMQNITIATISGRYYAMDRDQRWDRTKLFYNQLTQPCAQKVSLQTIINQNYKQNITDEFIKPIAVLNQALTAKDTLLCFNFRADRAQQMMQAFGNEQFSHFKTNIAPIKNLYSMTSYPLAPKHTQAIFELEKKQPTLGEIINNNNLRQLRIAETEKYAHVTFFLDGGVDKNFDKMHKIVVPSPKVATYDQKPEMSCKKITQEIIKAIEKSKFDVIIANYANADMVGHTGKLTPTIQAIEYIDQCLGDLIKSVKKHNGQLLITADHGNAEAMGGVNDPITSHSNNPVPLIYYGNKNIKLKNGGLANITPTLLDLLKIETPTYMLKSLIENMD